MRSTVPAAVAVALLATGCGAPAEDPAEESSPSSASESSPPGPTTLGFDETHTWDDGFAVSLSDFERFNAADEGYSDDIDYVTFTVTFDNGSEAPVELDRIMRSCQVKGVEVGTEAFSDLAHESPSMVQPGATGAWEPACEMASEETELQFSLEIYAPGDTDVASYPEVYFAGEVPE